MNINFDNNMPIYMQIVDFLKVYIIAGKFKPGEKLPSVRDFANDLKVNPNTMQKALQDLEELKIVYTERTNGKFVTNDEKLIKKYKMDYAKNLTKEYIRNMKTLGLSLEEIKKIMGEK